jgi:NADPH:quinone reductase-like Zn-dependent oxidoreductase
MVLCWLIDLACYLVGYYCLFKAIVWVAYELHALFSPRIDLAARYGKGTWTVITGGSEGIGYAFAKQFAELGFNIVLISRSEEKLTKAKAELEKAYSV